MKLSTNLSESEKSALIKKLKNPKNLSYKCKCEY